MREKFKVLVRERQRVCVCGWVEGCEGEDLGRGPSVSFRRLTFLPNASLTTSMTRYFLHLPPAGNKINPVQAGFLATRIKILRLLDLC